jgi:phosphatidylglycerol---prolipoprotein diacylglyceryl transferase
MTALAIPFPNIDPVAITFGPLHLKWYGLSYMAGLLLGWLYIRRLVGDPQLWRHDKTPFGLEAVDDLLLYVAIGVILGGRIGHVLLYQPGHYLQHPQEILAVWNGGMAFHGGLLGTTLAMQIFARRNSVSMWSVMDLVAATVPIGLFFGRVANFINAEIIGSPSSVPWAIVFPGAGPEPRHPSMLYEAALEGLALFLILRWFTHRQGSLKSPGLTAGIFVIGYGAFRIFCEFFKITGENIIVEGAPLTMGMAYSLPMLLIGFYFVWRARSGKTA